jgi:hypothetical protein
MAISSADKQQLIFSIVTAINENQSVSDTQTKIKKWVAEQIKKGASRDEAEKEAYRAANKAVLHSSKPKKPTSPAKKNPIAPENSDYIYAIHAYKNGKFLKTVLISTDLHFLETVFYLLKQHAPAGVKFTMTDRPLGNVDHTVLEILKKWK